jgi:hypothetical protein
MSRALWTTVARAFRRTAVPLAAYYAVTLALPLANGAARSGKAFAEHALVVLVVPLIAIVLACAVHTIARGRHRQARSSK